MMTERKTRSYEVGYGRPPLNSRSARCRPAAFGWEVNRHVVEFSDTVVRYRGTCSDAPGHQGVANEAA